MHFIDLERIQSARKEIVTPPQFIPKEPMRFDPIEQELVDNFGNCF